MVLVRRFDVGVVRPSATGGPADDVAEERRKQRAQAVREVESASDLFFHSDDEDGEAADREPGGAVPLANATASRANMTQAHTANGSDAPLRAPQERALAHQGPSAAARSARGGLAGGVDDTARIVLQQESALFREMLDILDDVIGDADGSNGINDKNGSGGGGGDDTSSAVDTNVRGALLILDCPSPNSS